MRNTFQKNIIFFMVRMVITKNDDKNKKKERIDTKKRNQIQCDDSLTTALIYGRKKVNHENLVNNLNQRQHRFQLESFFVLQDRVPSPGTVFVPMIQPLDDCN